MCIRDSEKGVQIVLASGRAYPGVAPFKKKIGINDYAIACGGAQVVDPDGKVVFSTYLSPVVTRQAMQWAADKGVHFQVYMDDGFHYLCLLYTSIRNDLLPQL